MKLIKHYNGNNSIWLLRKELIGKYYSAYEIGTHRKIRFQKAYIDKFMDINDSMNLNLTLYLNAIKFITTRRKLVNLKRC